MKFYDNSAYGFCEICRKTDIPTTLENIDGSFELICPSCAEATFDNADSVLPKLCEYGNCVREAVALCTKCSDAICTFHENNDGMCDACSPMTVLYSRGWSGSY